MKNKNLLEKAFHRLNSETATLYQRTDKKILFAIAAIAVFIVFFGIGDIATRWRMGNNFDGNETKKVENSKVYAKGAKNEAAYYQSGIGENKKDYAGNKNESSFFGLGYEGQNMKENIFVVIAIKTTLLVVLIALSVFLGIKIAQEYKRARKLGHGIRQLSKNHARAVKTARK